MGDHATHRSGDVNDCPDCTQAAYEPSWYAAMLAFSKEERDVIVLSAEGAIGPRTGR
jgi:hypothetical protein